MYFELRVFFPDREANRHNAYSRGSKIDIRIVTLSRLTAASKETRIL